MEGTLCSGYEPITTAGTFLHVCLFGFGWDGILDKAPLELSGPAWTTGADMVCDRDNDGAPARSPSLATRSLIGGGIYSGYRRISGGLGFSGGSGLT